MKNLLLLGILIFIGGNLFAEKLTDDRFPVRGICIRIPNPNRLNDFIQFIENELVPREVNTIVLRVDYDYQYLSHPELSNRGGWTKEQVKILVESCRKSKIRLIPFFDLLGHQSWHNITFNLLKVYPQFDETPQVKMPSVYVWPNPDSLADKSYCPLHPQVHAIVFDLIDELCDVFESDAFHAGMEEVLYIGDAGCPRCAGKDKSELFAGEVNTIRDHLALKNRQLWIWGDRLIDGKATGIGMWEASMNGTYRAVDLINKDVIICDWHYNKPEKTALYFAKKGFKVIACPWKNSDVAIEQTQNLNTFRKDLPENRKDLLQGVMQAIWSAGDSFFDEFNNHKISSKADDAAQEAECFQMMFKK